MCHSPRGLIIRGRRVRFAFSNISFAIPSILFVSTLAFLTLNDSISLRISSPFTEDFKYLSVDTGKQGCLKGMADVKSIYKLQIQNIDSDDKCVNFFNHLYLFFKQSWFW